MQNDIILNTLLFEMRGHISCGGHSIMQFTDYDGIIDANELLLDVSRNEIEARIN